MFSVNETLELIAGNYFNDYFIDLSIFPDTCWLCVRGFLASGQWPYLNNAKNMVPSKLTNSNNKLHIVIVLVGQKDALSVALSPPRSQNPSISADHDPADEEELDLLYDPCLNCYFDPRTHKYYELA